MPLRGFTPLLLWILPVWRVLTPVNAHPPLSRCHLMQNTAVCNDRRLSSVPADLSQNIEELQLHQNHITTLTDDSLRRYPALRTLSLACNQLTTIQSAAFRDSHVLTSLNFANNSLSVGFHESGAALNELRTLQSLDLSENKLDEEMVGVLLGNLTSVERLNLSGNVIQRLDEDIFRRLHRLTELDLQRNFLFEIDNAFHGNHKLQRLNLAFNSLPCLTDFHLTQLQVLNASNNLIDWFISRQDVNETFQLETLDLSHNNLLFFPFLPTRSHLQNLYLSDNRLSFYEHLDNSTNPNITTTVEFYNLKNYAANVTAQLWQEDLHGDVSSLLILDLRGNHVTYFPQGFIQKMPLLSRLKMSVNCLEKLNFTSERFSGSLYELDVSRNELNHVQASDDDLRTLGNLTYFNLSQNNLSFLPTRLFPSLLNLRSVDLSYNDIDVCVEEPVNNFSRCVDWKDVRNLKQLYLKSCNIKNIPNSAFSGMSLTHLELSENPGLNVEQSLQTLWTTLQHLGLGNTKIQNFDFSEFQSLKSLNISSNSLSQFPTSLRQIGLKSLDLRDNVLSTIPADQAGALATTLTTVYLTGNSFNCCQTEWFRTFEKQETLNIADKSDIKCVDFFRRTHFVERFDPSLCFVQTEPLFWYIVLFVPVCVSFVGISVILLLTVKPKVLENSIKKKCLKPTPY
ncbi:transforming growth factor beta activator LRRC33 [Periophthalmus magnuspinnatus]|uniref:transforming growth factor beta activator LRRC33 n=1 Tax=Periophthalmus magnuspinnatus TaxID=409849 RepID=UPI00145AF03A|nr:transforming growth factor beta activator LRRC33 [Periophthalmus magnuspinnatus]XP_055085993.1 transforming growth factor beta activator LRRC33 [Periophthalmus magnuspinnatus]